MINVIVDMVNNLDRSESCDAGILCRSKKAYIFAETESLELDISNKLSVTAELFVICCMIMIVI